MDESEQIILAIVFSIVGFISIIIIIGFLIWCILRRRSKSRKSNIKSSITHRQQYQRSQNLSSTNIINNKRKKRTKRFNTNDSAISFSFNPPHLINQNVKNLDKLFASESPLHYEHKQSTNKFDGCYTNSTTAPVYTSSSSISAPISNLAITFESHPNNPQLNNLKFQFLNELNRVLHLKQEQRPIYPIKYSQSCRQRNELLPFDYYRSMTLSTSSSVENLFEPNYIRTTHCSNATLMRKARLAQLRDDTAILY